MHWWFSKADNIYGPVAAAGPISLKQKVTVIVHSRDRAHLITLANSLLDELDYMLVDSLLPLSWTPGLLWRRLWTSRLQTPHCGVANRGKESPLLMGQLCMDADVLSKDSLMRPTSIKLLLESSPT